MLNFVSLVYVLAGIACALLSASLNAALYQSICSLKHCHLSNWPAQGLFFDKLLLLLFTFLSERLSYRSY